MNKNSSVPPIAERTALLRYQWRVASQLGIPPKPEHGDTVIVLTRRRRPSSVQVTRIFDAAHDVVCKAIALASKPENQSMGYTDIALSMIENVRASKLPGAKAVTRQLAVEMLLNAKEIIDACTNDVERDFRSYHFERAAELAQK